MYEILANKKLILLWELSGCTFLFHNALQCEMFIAYSSYRTKSESHLLEN